MSMESQVAPSPYEMAITLAPQKVPAEEGLDRENGGEGRGEHEEKIGDEVVLALTQIFSRRQNVQSSEPRDLKSAWVDL